MESREGGGGMVPELDLLGVSLTEGLREIDGVAVWVLGLEVTTGDTEVVVQGEGDGVMEGVGVKVP